MKYTDGSSQLALRVVCAIALFACCGFAHAAVIVSKFTVQATSSRASATNSAAAARTSGSSKAASSSSPFPHLFGDGFDGAWSVPAGRMLSGVVNYPTLGLYPYPAHTIRLDSFTTTLGDGDPRTAATAPFPGQSTSLCINGVPAGSYVALAFTPDAPTARASIAGATYGNEVAALLSASVSKNPGDFTNAIVGVGAGNALTNIVVLPYRNGFGTLLGETYYFNVKHAGSRAHAICLTNSPGRQP